VPAWLTHWLMEEAVLAFDLTLLWYAWSLQPSGPGGDGGSASGAS
jgi:hypothetical protein